MASISMNQIHVTSRTLSQRTSLWSSNFESALYFSITLISKDFKFLNYAPSNIWANLEYMLSDEYFIIGLVVFSKN
jgi:hypothetical protein